jgi:RHS repeat-associated protein
MLFQDDYHYDSLNRLSSTNESSLDIGNGGSWQSQFAQVYDYDRYGNRTINQTSTWGPVPKPNFGVNGANNRLTAPIGYAMDCDAAGNLFNDTYTGQGTRTYDAENRMTTAWANGQWQSYTYDGDGNRVRRNVNGTETWQVFGLGGELLAEYEPAASPSSPQKEYGYRNGELLVTAETSANLHYLVTDQLGTPRMVFDQTGNLAGVGRHDYLPFGEELFAGVGGRTTAQGYSASDGVRQHFTQKERDNETGLDYFLARYYSSTQGRFIAPDEFAGGPHEVGVLGGGDSEKQALPYAEIANPQSLNKYTYVYNNPLRFIDPDGHQGEDPICRFLRWLARQLDPQ